PTIHPSLESLSVIAIEVVAPTLMVAQTLDSAGSCDTYPLLPQASNAAFEGVSEGLFERSEFRERLRIPVTQRPVGRGKVGAAFFGDFFRCRKKSLARYHR
ncbi:MAG: hypothetical protein AAF420_11070, partial [Pseudomonadota bacterium]